MRRDCSLVRDSLPLYLEHMAGVEMEKFVKTHLASCPDCAGELERLRAGVRGEAAGRELREALGTQMVNAMRTTRKKLHKRASRITAAIAAVFLTVCLLLYLFPVYRLLEVGPMTMGNYYSPNEIAMALSLGSPGDRREVQAVLQLADQAFSDVGHTRAENEAAYGLLARYAASRDSYPNAASNSHSLELWSAHLESDEGWIWVSYSSKSYNQDGSTTQASNRAQALWQVARDPQGQ